MFTTAKMIQHLIILYKQCYDMVKAFLKVAYGKGKLHLVKVVFWGDVLP